MAAILDVRNLCKSHGGDKILDDLSFSVQAGEHLLLLGPSGSGKTTLINIITGLLTPDSGDVFIAGENITARNGPARDALRRRRIGIVFQTLRLVSALNVRDNLRLAQKLGVNKVDDAAIDQLLHLLGISHRAHAKPRSLSYGQAQRAAIARALITCPDILVADEPTSALDDANAELIASLLLDAAKAQGTTLVVATHDRRLKRHISNSLMLVNRQQEMAS